jgi:hypothetical protein
MDEFKSKFKAYSNEKLAQIIQAPDEYMADAVLAARAILAEREVPEEDLQQIVESIAIQQETQINRENEPLPKGIKVLLVVLPFLGIAGFAIVQLLLHERGLHQVRSDIFRYTLFGFLLWAAIIFLVTL